VITIDVFGERFGHESWKRIYYTKRDAIMTRAHLGRSQVCPLQGRRALGLEQRVVFPTEPPKLVELIDVRTGANAS
jgi:hypothetical protein